MVNAYLDRAIRTLYQLLKEEQEITFCIENRPWFHELPDLKSLAYILEDLKSPRLKYWHNTGYAYLQGKLGWAEEEAWLGKYGSLTAGAHLQDALGFETHLPPGVGEIDFKGILETLPKNALRVVDILPGTPLENVKLGVEELRKSGW
jgi:sugar phosphate isomerase/epimerase